MSPELKIDTQYSSVPEYPLPLDQAVFEQSMIDYFNMQFPESTSLLLQALNDVRSAAGRDATGGAISHRRSPNGHGYVYVTLRTSIAKEPKELVGLTSQYELVLPAGLRLDELDELHRLQDVPLSSQGRAEIDLARDLSLTDNRVIGPVPRETRAMLDGIYQLTGSTILRDDRALDEKSGVVVRQGTYGREKVYFVEDYTEGSENYGGRNVLRMRIVGEQLAEDLIRGQLSEREYVAWLALAGQMVRDTNNRGTAPVGYSTPPTQLELTWGQPWRTDVFDPRWSTEAAIALGEPTPQRASGRHRQSSGPRALVGAVVGGVFTRRSSGRHKR